jgi:cytochrome c oxidase subunit 2
MRPAARLTVVTALLATTGAACSSRFGAPEPATSQGARVLDLWRVLILTGIGLGALVVGLIAWSVVRYRRREGGHAAGFSENVRLELLYTAIPIMIVAVLFGITMGVQREVTHLRAEPDLRIEVTGFQWGWRFRYLTEGVTIVGTSNEPPTMVLPIGATARLILRSPDVIHSFYVPEFLEKRDLIPGVENRIDITPSRLGRFGGLCAEFCGLQHANMTFAVEIVEPEDFQAFVQEQQQQQQQQGTTPPGSQGGGNDPGGRAARAHPPDAGIR